MACGHFNRLLFGAFGLTGMFGGQLCFLLAIYFSNPVSLYFSPTAPPVINLLILNAKVAAIPRFSCSIGSASNHYIYNIVDRLNCRLNP